MLPKLKIRPDWLPRYPTTVSSQAKERIIKKTVMNPNWAVSNNGTPLEHCLADCVGDKFLFFSQNLRHNLVKSEFILQPI